MNTEGPLTVPCIDVDKFNRYADEGLIRKQTLDDLTIWNYTHKAQYAGVWDDVTTTARGLITKADGTIHARSFPKFWNLSEPPGPRLEDLPKTPPVITLKLDGFLGLTYWHHDDIHVASRSSFTSEYAQYATAWLRENNPNLKDELKDRDFTLVFEILYPYRRIVVDNSGKFGLVLLAVVHKNGDEMPLDFVETLGAFLRIPVVPRYTTYGIDDVLALQKILKGVEHEGFVAHWPGTGLRVKVKGDDSCKIHRLVTRLTKRRIWEMISGWKGDKFTPVSVQDIAQKLGDLVKILPKEYGEWAGAAFVELLEQVTGTLRVVLDAASSGDLHALSTRKAQVAYLQQTYPDLWREILYTWDGMLGVAEGMVWKRFKPEHEVPVLQDDEDEQ